ncbi:MAG: hypothetical protein M1822_008151 [Bathelium mastoideum]|nr:MAG: hypothetical protein M1822_008151 [Bathelium mastoideum]
MKQIQSNGGLISEPMLIRSYDNGLHWNYEGQLSREPHNWPIWKVAQAALRFVKSNARDTGTEERVEHVNMNPTVEGTREIGHLRPDGFGAVVSIGTSRGITISMNGSKIKPKQILEKDLDPEPAHEAVTMQMMWRQKPYYRLNDPGGLNMKLDEWKPKNRRFAMQPGSRTIKTIIDNFNEWIKLDVNYQEFQSCAKELVNRRRRRTNDETLWEHFATAIQFDCQENHCASPAFMNRDEFLSHFYKEHYREGVLAGEDLESRIEDWSSQWEYQPWRPKTDSDRKPLVSFPSIKHVGTAIPEPVRWPEDNPQGKLDVNDIGNPQTEQAPLQQSESDEELTSSRETNLDHNTSRIRSPSSDLINEASVTAKLGDTPLSSLQGSESASTEDDLDSQTDYYPEHESDDLPSELCRDERLVDPEAWQRRLGNLERTVAENSSFVQSSRTGDLKKFRFDRDWVLDSLTRTRHNLRYLEKEGYCSDFMLIFVTGDYKRWGEDVADLLSVDTSSIELFLERIRNVQHRNLAFDENLMGLS